MKTKLLVALSTIAIAQIASAVEIKAQLQTKAKDTSLTQFSINGKIIAGTLQICELNNIPVQTITDKAVNVHIETCENGQTADLKIVRKSFQYFSKSDALTTTIVIKGDLTVKNQDRIVIGTSSQLDLYSGVIR
jgi:hypothetical protein